MQSKLYFRSRAMPVASRLHRNVALYASHKSRLPSFRYRYRGVEFVIARGLALGHYLFATLVLDAKKTKLLPLTPLPDDIHEGLDYDFVEGDTRYYGVHFMHLQDAASPHVTFGFPGATVKSVDYAAYTIKRVIDALLAMDSVTLKSPFISPARGA